MGYEWLAPPGRVFEQLALNYAAQLHRAAFLLLQRYAPEIEAWMKENARWTDRTSNARQTLWAEAFDFIDILVLAFGHGVDYGTYLELSNGGAYAILTPALDHFAPRIWQDLQRMVS